MFLEIPVRTIAIAIFLAVIPLGVLPAQDVGAAAAITRDGDKFSCTIKKASLVNVIDVLFSKGEKEYALTSRPSMNLENLTYSGKDFDELLTLLLFQCNFDYTVRGDVYYIYEVQKKDAMRKLKETKVIQIQNMGVDALAALFPNELNAASLIKQDRSSNSLILTGSPSEIAPIEEFIREIDVPDGRNRNISVRLKYIKSDELLKNLPPSVGKGNITETSQPEIIFFSGTERQYREFMEELSVVDRPRQQIKYQLLVIQRQKTEGLNWGTSLGAGSSDKESGYSWTGMLSNIFNINFDIIAQFGLQFAGSLNAELSEGKSRVLADTTLNGISGEQVTFSNTNTYRYRDIIVDSKGDLYTSTTREIASGLTLSINGWASGDGMVTVKVEAMVSKQGSSESSSGRGATDTAAPPSTSEKKVSTNVRTKSGEPVIIGGLFQQEEDVSEKKVPFLGSIPLIGNLFKTRQVSMVESEFIIYLIPFVEAASDEISGEMENLERLQKKYADTAQEKDGV